MAELGATGRDPVRRFYQGLGVARLAVIGVVFVLTASPMSNLDDTAGRALGMRWPLSDRAPGVNGPSSSATVPAEPGSQLEITTTGSDTTCAVLDGTTWTPLDRVDELAGWNLSVGLRSRAGRRDSPDLRLDRITRIHRFVAIGEETVVRCEGYSATDREEVRRTDPLPSFAYQTVVILGRVLWVALLTSVVWVPLLVRRRRRLRAEAAAADAEARRSELPYQAG